MKFSAKRLFVHELDMVGFHLFDADGALVMVAEHGTPWQPEQEKHLLRFAYPNGQVVATMDLSGVPVAGKFGYVRTSFAVIYDMAVYAMISEFRPEDTAAADDTLPHYEIEVDGMAWVMAGQTSGNPLFALFEKSGSDPVVHASLLTDGLVPAIGTISALDGETFAIDLPDNVLRQPAVVALSLLYLTQRDGRFQPFLRE